MNLKIGFSAINDSVSVDSHLSCSAIDYGACSTASALQKSSSSSAVATTASKHENNKPDRDVVKKAQWNKEKEELHIMNLYKTSLSLTNDGQFVLALENLEEILSSSLMAPDVCFILLLLCADVC